MMEKSESEDLKSEEEISDVKTEIEAFPKGDLILVVEGRELYVNKRMMLEASPVFRAMLESDFKESKQERIDLPGKSYEAMVEFLKCTYPFLNYPITVNNVFDILPLAEEYQTNLKRRCEMFMNNILRGKETFFIHRTDAFRTVQHGSKMKNFDDKRTLLIKYHSNVPKTMNQSSSNLFGGSGVLYPSNQITSHFGTTPRASALTQPVAQTKPDATCVDDFSLIGFGKDGYEVGNTVPAEIVIKYVLEAEKNGCNEFLKIAIQYIAMRNFSHFEAAKGFSEISLENRHKITMLRLRILENYRSNGFEINDLLFRT